MMRSIMLAASLAAFFALPCAAAAKVGGGDVTYEPKGVGKVVFTHEYHVSLKNQKCGNCHYKTFQMKSGESTYKMDMSMLTKGQFCGSCHDGKSAFDVKDASSCKRCHKE